MGKRILIVDDEPDILKVAVYRLKKAGYEVISAEDGGTGLNLAFKEKPDLILLDLRLPVMDGFDVCQQLKSNPEFKNIPVILFTASSDKAVEEKAKEIGADGHLMKPFEPQELLEIVKRFIG